MTEDETKARLIMSQFSAINLILNSRLELTRVISTATLQNNFLPESLSHFINRNHNLGQ